MGFSFIFKGSLRSCKGCLSSFWVSALFLKAAYRLFGRGRQGGMGCPGGRPKSLTSYCLHGSLEEHGFLPCASLPSLDGHRDGHGMYAEWSSGMPGEHLHSFFRDSYPFLMFFKAFYKGSYPFLRPP